MSNGLADASFFPTAKELSTGLRWVKDHPVLAAAAATAVSVITFLNAAESLAHSRSSANVLDTDNDVEHGNDRSVSDAAATGFHKTDVTAHRRTREAERSADAPSTATVAAAIVVNATVAAATAAGASASTSPTTVAIGACSDDKLAAAVSWCDEHGGSLTQVFEHLLVDDDSHSNSSDEADAAQMTAMRRRPAIKKSATLESIQTAAAISGSRQQQLPPARDVGSPMLFSPSGRRSHNPNGETESPQWGWYVAITPPQDQMQV